MDVSTYCGKIYFQLIVTRASRTKTSSLVFFLAIDYFILLVFNNIGEVHVRCHWNDKTRQRSIERMKGSLLDTFIVQHQNLNCGLFTLLLCREQRENLHSYVQ